MGGGGGALISWGIELAAFEEAEVNVQALRVNVVEVEVEGGGAGKEEEEEGRRLWVLGSKP